jgi:methylmalonyl-CoA mutase
VRVADAEAVPVRQIDNSAVLTAQLARLSSVKASRDDAAVAAALQAIEAAARSSERQPNLMELAVQVRPLKC